MPQYRAPSNGYHELSIRLFIDSPFLANVSAAKRILLRLHDLMSGIWSPPGGEHRQASPSRIPAVHVAAAAAKNPMSDWVVTNWQPRLMRST